jgi:TonB family protein
MSLISVFRAARPGLALFAVLVTRLAAQNLLLTEYKGKLLPVIRASDTRALVEVDGKQVAADSRRFALHKVEEYLPAFISVRDIDVITHHLDLNGSDINHEFRMRAWLETPYWLDDVFIVLELDTESAGKVLFLYEVGDLRPRDPKLLSVRVPLSSALGPGRYEMHLFSKGMEVLHSSIDAMYRESVVDRMTEKRIASVKDAGPKLFVGPQPEYPAALFKAKTSGKAVVTVRIGANGRVYDPVLKSASDPAFGQAALAAVRLWRFLPLVKAGRPVETHADVPIDFTPPADKAKKP